MWVLKEDGSLWPWTYNMLLSTKPAGKPADEMAKYLCLLFYFVAQSCKEFFYKYSYYSCSYWKQCLLKESFQTVPLRKQQHSQYSELSFSIDNRWAYKYAFGDPFMNSASLSILETADKTSSLPHLNKLIQVQKQPHKHQYCSYSKCTLPLFIKHYPFTSLHWRITCFTMVNCFLILPMFSQDSGTAAIILSFARVEWQWIACSTIVSDHETAVPRNLSPTWRTSPLLIANDYAMPSLNFL